MAAKLIPNPKHASNHNFSRRMCIQLKSCSHNQAGHYNSNKGGIEQRTIFGYFIQRKKNTNQIPRQPYCVH